MGLARSSFYAAKKITPAQSRDAEIAQKIAQIQREHNYTIGRRRMGALLMKYYGLRLGESQIQRIMSSFALTAVTRQVRKAKPQAGKATNEELPANLLNRQFSADRPYQRMVTDVTYIPYFEEGQWYWGYLCLVQDLYDRSIVAWNFQKKQDVNLALGTLYILRQKNLAPDAMLHSDRGSIYTAERFRRLEQQFGLTHSYSRTANCHDNATMECFNGTFKVETLYNTHVALDHPSFSEQMALIKKYIEYYNTKRPCSIIGNVPPVDYREQYYRCQADLK
jgi:putative transposase